MQADIFGRYITCLRTNGRNYAIFDKDYVGGGSTLVMYEVEEQSFARRNQYGFPQPCPLPGLLSQDAIPVYRASYAPAGQEELELLLADKSPACHDPQCQWHPARVASILELKEEPEVEEVQPPWELPSPAKGYLETSWTLRTASTPPPYVRMDNRRRPTSAAYIVEEELPVSPPVPANTVRLPRPNTFHLGVASARPHPQFLLDMWDSAHSHVARQPPAISPATIERRHRDISMSDPIRPVLPSAVPVLPELPSSSDTVTMDQFTFPPA